MTSIRHRLLALAAILALASFALGEVVASHEHAHETVCDGLECAVCLSDSAPALVEATSTSAESLAFVESVTFHLRIRPSSPDRTFKSPRGPPAPLF